MNERKNQSISQSNKTVGRLLLMNNAIDNIMDRTVTKPVHCAHLNSHEDT